MDDWLNYSRNIWMEMMYYSNPGAAVRRESSTVSWAKAQMIEPGGFTTASEFGIKLVPCALPDQESEYIMREPGKTSLFHPYSVANNAISPY